MNPYIVKKIKEHLTDFFSNPETRKNRHQIFREIIDANAREGAAFYFVEIELTNLLKGQRVARSVSNTAFERISEIESISVLYNLLKELIIFEATSFESSGKASYDTESCELVIALANEEQLRDDLMQWVNDEYAPVDERIEVTRRKKVRRFDSLARVLSSQMPSISVCCAVTIDTSTFSPRLVIGANLTASVHNTAFLKELNHKLKILKNSYTEYTFGRIKLPNTIGCEQLALDLHNKLFPGRQALNAVNEPNDLAQAVYKLTDALFYDPHTFTDEEKQSFLNANATIVLLPTTTSTSVEMQINYLTMRGQIQTNEPLTSTVHPDELKFVHAEQLIALYLYEQNKIPKSTRFILGISKLCCATCSNFLESYPGIELRGHHQKQYQGVINLTNGFRTAHSSIRLGPTGADKSPFKTPLKLHERLDDIEQSIDSASRQLTNQKRIPLDFSGMLEPTSRRFLGLSGVFAPTSRRLFFDSYDESSTSDLEGIRPDF